MVVVRSPGQPLPSLPRGVEVLDDRETGRGPLAGMAVGLAALAGRGEVAYVSSTDAPMLHPAFVRTRGCRARRRTGCVRSVRARLSSTAGGGLQGRPRGPCPAPARCGATPTGRSARDLSVGRTGRTPAARGRGPCPTRPRPRLGDEPERLVRLRGSQGPDRHRRWRSTASAICDRPGAPRRTLVRAATVGAAAAAVGTPLSDRVTGALNGELLGPDPEEPTVEGDVISLTSAAPEPMRAVVRAEHGAVHA